MKLGGIHRALQTDWEKAQRRAKWRGRFAPFCSWWAAQKLGCETRHGEIVKRKR